MSHSSCLICAKAVHKNYMHTRKDVVGTTSTWEVLIILRNDRGWT